MLDIGWSELLVIGIVALIVVGPKDLPVMFRSLGQAMGKARGMAREFTSAMNAAADETGVRDIGRELNKMGNVANPRKAGLNALKDAAGHFEDWEPDAAASHGRKAGKGEPERTDGPATQALRQSRKDETAALKETAAPRMPPATKPDEPAA